MFLNHRLKNIRALLYVVYVVACVVFIGITLITSRIVNAQSTTYYVDCAALINGSGAQNSPWNSLTPFSPVNRYCSNAELAAPER
jgi:hypothetical protein